MDLTTTALDAPQHSVSLLALFLQASLVVKLVMFGLILASVWCWAIIVEKVALYARVKRRMDAFEGLFWSGQSLESLLAQVERDHAAKPATGLAALFLAAMREWKRSHEAQARSFAGVTARVDKALDVALARETDALEDRLLVLASTGSAAPFIGLFGTVWGIMTSFQAIAGAQNANLAVVAPGIAEALLATALGLLAAIPATIAYNRFAARVQQLAGRMESFADEFSSIISRQIDAQSQHRARAAAPQSQPRQASQPSPQPSQPAAPQAPASAYPPIPGYGVPLSGPSGG